MQSPLFDITEAAEYIRLKPATLNNWVTQGKGPAYVKVGRKRMYLKQDLDAWLESQRIK